MTSGQEMEQVYSNNPELDLYTTAHKAHDSRLWTESMKELLTRVDEKSPSQSVSRSWLPGKISVKTM